MSPEERIIQLEREVRDTRLAAASIIIGMVDGIVKTPEWRSEIAEGFEQAASEGNGPAADISRLVALALRRG